jgi:aspartyl-tRNA(Asn)/glutamyl-tRNA(Gln) amidotransferase subunit C
MSQSPPEATPQPNRKIQPTRDSVLRVAELARLPLTEAEVTLYTGQLEAILNYFDSIAEVDVSSVEPLVHPHQDRVASTPLREDRQREESLGAAMLACAPELEEGGFRVPPVL